MRAILPLAALMLITACHKAPPAEFKVDGAWVRLPAVQVNPGAAYFTVHGGKDKEVLLKVSAPFAVRTEMHQSMAGMSGDKDMMTMKPLPQVDVPAGGEVKFSPGGNHVMLFDVTPDLKPGEKAPLTLDFADGKKVTVQAVVIGAGDPEPK